MRKRISRIVITSLILMFVLCSIVGCGEKETAGAQNKPECETLEDGSYNVNISMEGGTGKATITSPASVEVRNGEASIKVLWSSKNYDYMIVNNVKYLNEAPTGEQSRFTFPIDGIPCDMKVIGDTTAMSTPHEIEYTIHISLAE